MKRMPFYGLLTVGLGAFIVGWLVRPDPRASSAPASGAVQQASTGSAPAKAELGKKAPDFTLKDVYGRSFTLSDFRGHPVVLEWMNQDCPIWRGRLKVLQDSYKKVSVPGAKEGTPVKKGMTGVIWLCIDSTHYMKPGRNRAFAAVNGIAKPILMDPEGKVGRRYDARTTPHIFVIDKEGTLVYDGALDNARTGEAEKKNYTVEAVKAVLAGKEVPASKTNPYGCSVKYK